MCLAERVVDVIINHTKLSWCDGILISQKQVYVHKTNHMLEINNFI